MASSGLVQAGSDTILCWMVVSGSRFVGCGQIAGFGSGYVGCGRLDLVLDLLIVGR